MFLTLQSCSKLVTHPARLPAELFASIRIVQLLINNFFFFLNHRGMGSWHTWSFMLSMMVMSFFSLAWLSCSQPLVIKSWLNPGIMPMIWEKGPIFITLVNCSYLRKERLSNPSSNGVFTNMSLNVNSPCLSLSISLSLLWPTIKSKFTTHFQYTYCICLKTMMMVAWWGASPNCSSPTLSTKVSKSPMPLIKTHCKIHKFNRCRTVPTQKFLNKSFGSKLF